MNAVWVVYWLYKIESMVKEMLVGQNVVTVVAGIGMGGGSVSTVHVFFWLKRRCILMNRSGL